MDRDENLLDLMGTEETEEIEEENDSMVGELFGETNDAPQPEGYVKLHQNKTNDTEEEAEESNSETTTSKDENEPPIYIEEEEGDEHHIYEQMEEKHTKDSFYGDNEEYQDDKRINSVRLSLEEEVFTTKDTKETDEPSNKDISKEETNTNALKDEGIVAEEREEEQKNEVAPPNDKKEEERKKESSTNNNNTPKQRDVQSPTSEAMKKIIEENFNMNGIDITSIISTSLKNECDQGIEERAKAFYDEVATTTLTAISHASALKEGEKYFKTRKEIILEVLEGTISKRRGHFTRWIFENYTKNIIQEFEKASDKKDDLVSAYKDAIKMAILLPDKIKGGMLKNSCLYTTNLEKGMRESREQGAFFYTPIDFYLNFFREEEVNKETRLGQKYLIQTLEDMALFNIFEEDILKFY